MQGEQRPAPGLIVNILKGLLLTAAFVAVSSLFAFLLQPLVEPLHGQGSSRQNRSSNNLAGKLADKAVIKSARAAPSAPMGVATAPEPAALPPGPKIAVLITEIGADTARGARAIEKLPPSFALAFLPGKAASRALARKARLDGHEVWIGLPMQPRGWPKVSPGPNTLLLADEPAINAKRVEWALSQIDHPAGAYTMMGSAFTADAKAMEPVAAAMKKHGLVLLDARSIGGTVAAKAVTDAGGRALSNDMFIDADPRPQAIAAALDRLARQARARGHAVAIARALPTTLRILPEWAKTLESNGISLVPPSRLAP